MADIKQIIFNILKVGADAPSVRLNTFVSQYVVAYIARVCQNANTILII